MDTKNVKLPIGKIFIYALAQVNIMILIVMAAPAIITILTQGVGFIDKIEIEEAVTMLSFHLGFVLAFTLISFPIMLYDYHMVRNIIIKLNYTFVKIENKKVHFRTSQVNYTLKIRKGRNTTYFSLSSEDDRTYDTVNSFNCLEKSLSQLKN